MKTIGFSQEQYDEIVAIGKRCGFNMNAGRKGQRAKFIAVAVKIAEVELTALKSEDGERNDGNPNPDDSIRE